MARIKIKDLPRDMKVSEDEMRKVRGGSIPPDPYKASLLGGGVLPSIYTRRLDLAAPMLASASAGRFFKKR